VDWVGQHVQIPYTSPRSERERGLSGPQGRADPDLQSSLRQARHRGLDRHDLPVDLGRASIVAWPRHGHDQPNAV